MELEKFRLPMSVIGRTETSRLIRELTRLDDFFVAAASRKSGAVTTPPQITRMLDETARLNNINLLEANPRKQMSDTLKELEKKAPGVNISFAAEPSPRSFEQVLVWLRQNIHPQVLVQIGLMPGIAAGCILRTPNKIFDMSLASKLNAQEDYLGKLIDGAARG